MATQLWAGIDIGGTKTAVVLSSAPPALLGRIQFPTDPANGPQPAITRIIAALRQLLATHGFSPAHLTAIGVSCGGPLSPRLGLIQAPPNLATWVDVPIVQLLHTEFGCRVALENDANAGAIAEHRFGAGRGAQNMIFLTLGTGLGAGIILNNQLYSGSSEAAGEIGHVRLTRRGPVGYYKAGSVEGWASGGGLAQTAARMVASARRRGQPSSLLALPGPITARLVGEAAQAGDLLALRILAAGGTRLGEALAILVDILNPERIVMGGMAMRLGDLLLAPARRTLAREALPQSVAACRLVPAQLGENIGDIAALCIALADPS